MHGPLLAILLGGVALLPGTPVQSAGSDPKRPATEAERITRIRETIEQGRVALSKMNARLEDPEGEYHRAEADFQKLDRKVQAEQDAIASLKKEGKTDEAVKREAGLQSLREQWELARDRFDLAIRQRKATQEAMAALKDRIDQEQKELDKLEGKAPPVSPAPQNPPLQPGTAPSSAPPPAAPPPVLAPAGPAVNGPGNTPSAPDTPAEGTPPAEPDDPVVRQAREQLEARRKALAEAESQAASTRERVAALRRTIQAAEKVLEAERLSADQAQTALGRLTDTLRTKPPADPAEWKALVEKADETAVRLAEARVRIKRLTDRLAELNEELHRLEQEESAALRVAETRRAEAREADQQLAEVVSPFTTRNLLRWLTAHGPNLLAISVGVAILYVLVRIFSRHIVRVVARHNNRGSEDDRNNRAYTLVGVFRYAGSVLVLGGGVVMFLDEAGVPVVPLMGGAAVIGLAVAFGAQNLIRDYFSGFMILMEDQYGVNDVVRIGTTAGLVEKITLRVTALRDLEGVLHFIPHGSITTVSNLTHTWSRAQIDVPVPYDANLEQVIGLLTGIGNELRQDPYFGLKITEDPEMLGVEAFADSGVIVRFLLKTRPLQQWAVRREILRRIKLRFDELGLRIPFPQRTLHLRPHEGTGVAGVRPAEADDENRKLWAA